MMKSLLLVFWNAWEWGPKRLPSLRYLTTSFSDKNVTRDISKVRRLVESEAYQALWGDLVEPTPKWGEHLIVNKRTGFREGRAFASMTGGRGDRVAIDDPHSVDTAESDAERAATIKTFREAIPDRLNDMRKSVIVVIMQRLHEDDVAGTILKLKLPYVHLNLPMEFDSTRRCRTHRKDGSLLFEDPRTADGELLFPERFPREVVEGLKHSKGAYAYSGQYQQRPTPREGGLFKRAFFAGKIISRTKVPAGLRLRVRAWDFASRKAKPGKPPDWTSGVLMGRLGSDYYVFDARHFQDTPGVVMDTVEVSAELDPPGTIIRIPQDPGQAGVAQVESYVKELSGFTVVAKPPSGAKEVRASPFATQAEHGHVYLVNSVEPEDGLDPWIEPFVDELCGFPNGPDDQVDAAADAFNELSQGFAGKFEVLSGGRRETAETGSRDRRYNFEDNEVSNSGRGYGSASAPHYGV
jgi:predicted phage terminase large subunit-like protein